MYCCQHDQEQHSITGLCSVCGCWGPGNIPDSHIFSTWPADILRTGIATRRRLLALGYPSARMQRKARETMEAMEEGLRMQLTGQR